MVMHDINVSTNRLQETAEQIRTINLRLYDDLCGIESILKLTEAIWESEAANQIRMAMNELHQKFFEEYKLVVNNYADYLEQASMQYESTENTIKTNASMFM